MSSIGSSPLPNEKSHVWTYSKINYATSKINKKRIISFAMNPRYTDLVIFKMSMDIYDTRVELKGYCRI